MRMLIYAVLLVAVAQVAQGRPRRGDRQEETLPADTPGAEAFESTTPQTFLDTLNRGREVSLSEADLQPAGSAPTPAAPAVERPASGGAISETPITAPPKPPAGSRPAAASAELLRIQCMASTQSDAIQEASKRLATQVSYPVMVLFVPPYYKLLVGEFFRREDAERALYDIKGHGYPDAWIVKGMAVEGQ